MEAEKEREKNRDAKKRKPSGQIRDGERSPDSRDRRNADRDRPNGSGTGRTSPRRNPPPDGQDDRQVEQIAMDRLMPLSGRQRFSEQYMPYLWAALALFLTVCFILDVAGKADTPQEHPMGYVGYWICRVLFGLFGWGAFLLPAVNVMMTVSWRRYCREHMVSFQISMSVLFMLLLAAFIHVCVCSTDTAYLTAVPTVLFRTGAALKSGGVLGGWLGWLMYMGLRLPGSIVLMVIAMPLVCMFLLGVTPKDAAMKLRTLIRRAVRARRDRADTERKRRQAEFEQREQTAQQPAAGQKKDGEGRHREDRGRTEETADAADAEPLRGQDSLSGHAVQTAASAEKAVSPAEDDAASADTDTREAAERRAVWVDPVTGEVLREGGMHREEAAADGGSVGQADSAEAESPAGERPVADHTEIDMDAEPERTDELPSPDDPATDSPDADADAGGVTADSSAAGMPASASGGRTAVPVTVLPPDTSVMTEASGAPESELPAESAAQTDAVLPDKSSYVFPDVSLLTRGNDKFEADPVQIEKNIQILRSTLESFKIRIKSISCSCGPTITRYEVRPEAGVRIRSISALVDDIALNLAKSGVRIEAPIPGKSAVGIEVPNDSPSLVYLRNLLETPEFKNAKSRITACLGCEVSGRPVLFDINKMPHLLVSGTTGSGKSVCINCIILSILYKATPEEVKLILVDPKKVEFSVYRNIPHLYCPIVTDPKKAAGALYSAVAEMERRFELIEEVGVRNLAGYNEVTAGDNEHPPIPQMIIIIDELADLMMTAPADVEAAICRLAQKGRAAGIHLILGTQRPSVDVITGLIKANVPSRIAFTVMSQVDSRTIIDVAGAEKLIGRGDMLYAPVGAAKPLRVQGAFVSDQEVEKVVDFVKSRNEGPTYDEDFMQTIEIEAARCGTGKKHDSDSISLDDLGGAGGDGEDPKFWEAVEIAVNENKVSTSLLQRRVGLGYGRAAKIIDRMQEMGFVGPSDGNKPRKMLLTQQDLAEIKMNKRK